MEHKDSLLGVLKTLFKWKKQIITICAITALGSVIIALLLPNYYKSTTIFYAASPDLGKPESVGPMDEDRDYYGEEEDVDRVLTICESNKIADFLINKYKLYEHYDIDSTHKKAAFKVREKFYKLYEVVKTKYSAIEISIEDKDPEMAMNMVNDARAMVDKLGQQLIKESQYQSIVKQQNTINTQQKKLIILADSLAVLRGTYGIYNTKFQSELMAELLAKAESKLTRTEAKLEEWKSVTRPNRDTIQRLNANIRGYTKEVESLQERVALLNSGISFVEALEQEHEEAREQAGLDNERIKHFQAALEAEFTAIYLVEPGDLPIVKYRPKRSILVIAAVLIAFLFCVIGVLVLEAYKDVDWKEIVNAK